MSCMYEFPRGSKWKQLSGYTELGELCESIAPTKVHFCTWSFSNMDTSDTLPFTSLVVFPMFDITFDKIVVKAATDTFYLMGSNGTMAFHNVAEIHRREDITGDTVIRVRCKYEDTQKTFFILLQKSGEISK